MTQESDPIHLIIRYADREVETISAHQGVIDKHGAVWIGKIGKPLDHKKVERINKQVATEIPSYLYMVQKVGSRYEAHKGKIIEASRSFPSSKDKGLIPKYYDQQNITNYVSLWIKVSSLVKADRNALSRLKIAATGTTLTDALGTSMAGFFVVKDCMTIVISKRRKHYNLCCNLDIEGTDKDIQSGLLTKQMKVLYIMKISR